MQKRKIAGGIGLRVNTSVKGETIEQKIARMLSNKEPFTDNAPVLYSERKEGVLPQTDIRTDVHDLAIDAMDIRQKVHLKKRTDRHFPENTPEGKTKNITEGKSIQGTENSSMS